MGDYTQTRPDIYTALNVRRLTIYSCVS